MTTFKANAEYSTFEYQRLQVETEAILEKEQGGYSFTKIIVQPILTIASEGDREQAVRLLEKTERACLISRSIKSQIESPTGDRSARTRNSCQCNFLIPRCHKMPNTIATRPKAGQSAYYSMDRDELLRALEMFAKNWLAHDGCWFLAAEESLGMEEAIELDTLAWQRFAVTEANRIMSTFGIAPGGGLVALEKALSLRQYSLINAQRSEWSEDGKRLGSSWTFAGYKRPAAEKVWLISPAKALVP